MSPSAPSESVPASRDRILQAAADLSKERGVDGATIAKVCQRSGLPVSSVYWHFDDKDSLFAEVIRSSFARWTVSVPRWEVTDETTLDGGLRRVLLGSARTFAEVPDFIRVGMQVVLDTGDTHSLTRTAYMEVRDQVSRAVAAWLKGMLPQLDPVAADDVASLVVAFSDGMVVASLVHDDWDPEPHIELFLDMVLGLLDSLTPAG